MSSDIISAPPMSSPATPPVTIRPPKSSPISSPRRCSLESVGTLSAWTRTMESRKWSLSGSRPRPRGTIEESVHDDHLVCLEDGQRSRAFGVICKALRPEPGTISQAVGPASRLSFHRTGLLPVAARSG